MKDCLVAAQDVQLIYGTGPNAVHALNSVSLDVRRGELTLILGPSGSGKTTLLQILGALIRPTSGSVRVRGEVIEHLSEAQRRRLRLDFFGFIFQAHHLIPTLTAWENVAMALDLKGIRGHGAQRRSRALLDELGMSGRADAYPAQLSGGQRQRVAIARACALGAPVILADEPTASLDSATGWQVIQLLRNLVDRQGTAIVIVTHDKQLHAAADRAVFIKDGRIVGEPILVDEQAYGRSSPPQHPLAPINGGA